VQQAANAREPGKCFLPPKSFVIRNLRSHAIDKVRKPQEFGQREIDRQHSVLPLFKTRSRLFSRDIRPYQISTGR